MTSGSLAAALGANNPAAYKVVVSRG